MAEDHIFFSVKKIGHKYCAIRYTPRPASGYNGKLIFNMAFDVLIAGQSLADKEVSLQMIADTLNEAVARDEGKKENDKLEAARLKVERKAALVLKLEQAARNLLSALTPEGKVEKLAASDLAALLGEGRV